MATTTILLLHSIFRTTLEVSSKLYFVEICYVLEKLWPFNHEKADFWLPNFGFKSSHLSLLNCIPSHVNVAHQLLTISQKSIGKLQNKNVFLIRKLIWKLLEIPYLMIYNLLACIPSFKSYWWGEGGTPSHPKPPQATPSSYSAELYNLRGWTY